MIGLKFSNSKNFVVVYFAVQGGKTNMAGGGIIDSNELENYFSSS